MARARIILLIALLAFFAAACDSSEPSEKAGDKPSNEQAQKQSGPSQPASSRSGSSEPTPLETVRVAYKKTVAARTAKVAFKGVGTGLPGPNDKPLTMFLSGEGAADNRSGDAAITMRVPPVGNMETRVVGDAMYMKFQGNFSGQLPGGKPWAKMDLNELAREQYGTSFSEMQGASATPEEQLGYLRGVSDSVEKLGEEPVRGTPTTHYRAVVNLEKAAAAEKDPRVRQAYEQMREQIGAPRFPMEVWLDDKDRVRRTKTVTPVPEPQAAGEAPRGEAGRQGKMTMVYEYYDFGAPVRVVAPPADQTVDITDMAMQGAPASGSQGTPNPSSASSSGSAQAS